jgi:hypothetical protein
MGNGESIAKQCFIKEILIKSRMRVYTVPLIPQKQNAIFNDEIRLLGYDMEIDSKRELILLTLIWKADKIPQGDYKRFVHLYDPSANTVVSQDDSMPRNWTYPTSWWDKGEIISETIQLSLEDVADGTYKLGIGWYEPESLIRLTITDGNSSSIEDVRFTLTTPIVIR